MLKIKVIWFCFRLVFVFVFVGGYASVSYERSELFAAKIATNTIFVTQTCNRKYQF